MAVRLLLNLVEGDCPNHCVWCYKDQRPKYNPVPEQDLKAFLNLNFKEDIQDVLFMGLGETLDHPEFSKIIELFQNHKIGLPMFNTSLITSPSNPFSLKHVKALLPFRTINIEAGGLTRKSRFLNMKSSMDEFCSNLDILHIYTDPSITSISIKLLRNKNNYLDFENHLDVWRKKYPKFNFWEGSLQVFEEKYFDLIVKASNPRRARDTFINNNFDKNFPYIPENYTKEPYDETRHTFKEGWFIGVDSCLYTCQNMALMRDEKYNLGKISETKLSEVRETDKFKNIVDAMRECKATPLCRKTCQY